MLLVILTIIRAYLQVWSKITLVGLPQCVFDKIMYLQVENFDVTHVTFGQFVNEIFFSQRIG